MGTRAVIDFLLAPLGRSRARSGDTARAIGARSARAIGGHSARDRRAIGGHTNYWNLGDTQIFYSTAERPTSYGLVPRCFRWVPFPSLWREREVIHRLLRFPQMFLVEPGGHTGTWWNLGTHKFSIQRLSGLHRMVWFLAAFGGYPSPRSGESGQSSTDCSDFCRCFWGFHSAARAEESAARNPKLPKFRIERWALSLPEGAERVSRAAAKLCERSRSSKKGSAGPGGAGEPRRAHTRTVLRPLPGHAVVFGETGGGAQGARLPTG